jgi:hypothetical protein
LQELATLVRWKKITEESSVSLLVLILSLSRRAVTLHRLLSTITSPMEMR